MPGLKLFLLQVFSTLFYPGISSLHDAGEIIKQLNQSFSGANVHYWLMPVLNSGHI